MTGKPAKLRETLFNAEHGGIACDAINALFKHAKKGDDAARQALADYALKGEIQHMRDHACCQLGKAIQEGEALYSEIFRKGLRDQQLQYWSIPGLIRCVGSQAYPDLVSLVRDSSVRLEVRCQAVKCLAMHSRQRFDRGLPSDPGFWKADGLRLEELAAWEENGFPRGSGYRAPKRHPALDAPQTELELVVAKLDAKLAKEREEEQDAANPMQWLAKADAGDLRTIRKRWKLPSVYLDFLTRFSPIAVTIESNRFCNPFQLFGAGELIDAQAGYADDSEWPPHLVVIASHGGDPFVLDLSESDGRDAPVATAEHGIGVWEFEREADSFTDFLKSLLKG